MSPCWLLLEPLSWCFIFKSCHHNSFGDQAPMDFVYRCLISNEFQRLDYMTGYQDSNPTNDHQATYSFSLQWHNNEHDGISNHLHLHCLLHCWFRPTSKKTSKLRVTGLCANSPVTGEFPTQKASNTENVSIWWCHHVYVTHIKLCSKVSNQWGYHLHSCVTYLPRLDVVCWYWFSFTARLVSTHCRDHSGYGLSQWDVGLHYNGVYHWVCTQNDPCTGCVTPLIARFMGSTWGQQDPGGPHELCYLTLLTLFVKSQTSD